MRKREEKLRQLAAKLLDSGEVALVMGYTRGSELLRTRPMFIDNARDAEKLLFNPLCSNNLVKYLTEYRNAKGKIAVFVKGCDSRAVNRLIQDKQIDREKLVVLGLPCPGLLDAGLLERSMAGNDALAAAFLPGTRLVEVIEENEGFTLVTDKGSHHFLKKDFLMEKCTRCTGHNPVLYDYLLGDAVTENDGNDSYEDVKKLDGLLPKEKSIYWDRQFERCLRCYACRNVCPACTCRECVFDQAQPVWVARANNLQDNTSFHLVRAFHVAGRCVDCGQCQEVCPVNIPLAVLNRKILQDIKGLYGVSTPGLTDSETPVLGGFHTGDPDEYM